MNNKKTYHPQKGFTLIELLVCIAIVGILTTIALPQYKIYRQQAFDAVTMSDVHSLVLAEEAYFLDNQSYKACENESCTTLPSIMRLSKGISAKIEVTVDSFKITAKHIQGSKTIIWDSALGGLR
jgi:prepilin-type N-terminal cleavage/methylation domain-containing protein